MVNTLGDMLLIVLALALSVLALGCAAFSLVFVQRFSDASALHQRISTTESDLTDLSDRVHHWMRRSSVRRTREKDDTSNPDLPHGVTAHPKAALYARARAINGKANQ